METKLQQKMDRRKAELNREKIENLMSKFRKTGKKIYLILLEKMGVDTDWSARDEGEPPQSYINNNNY